VTFRLLPPLCACHEALCSADVSDADVKSNDVCGRAPSFCHALLDEAADEKIKFIIKLYTLMMYF
jgi:hypothetical protein